MRNCGNSPRPMVIVTTQDRGGSVRKSRVRLPTALVTAVQPRGQGPHLYPRNVITRGSKRCRLALRQQGTVSTVLQRKQRSQAAIQGQLRLAALRSLSSNFSMFAPWGGSRGLLKMTSHVGLGFEVVLVTGAPHLSEENQKQKGRTGGGRLRNDQNMHAH